MSSRTFRFAMHLVALGLLAAASCVSQAQTIGLNTVTAHFGGHEHTHTVYVDTFCRTAPAPGTECFNSQSTVREFRDFRAVTPGIYVRLPSGLTFGGYNNSLGQPTWHAGWTWETAGRGLALTVSAASGYREGGLVPLVVPSARVRLFGSTALRMSAIPSMRASTAALHLSLEQDL